ncbi:MAG: hypothetical protein KIT73_02505 [Burkholderiales bacterium]|nr:hypothetical protein [Burkholderiales bacterium]
MTVQTEVSRVSHAGDGVTIGWSVPFQFDAATDLVVIKVSDTAVETVLVINTDYTVSGVGNPAGGLVTTSVAIGNTDNIVIFLDPPLTQGADFTPFDDFPAETTERAFDKVTRICQRVKDMSRRSFRLSEGVPFTPNLTLTPIPDYVLRWSPDGQSLVGVPASDLSPALASQVALAQAAAVTAANEAADAAADAAQAALDAAAIAAMLAGPSLTGTPTTTTPGGADDSARIANTAWVRDLLAAMFAAASGNSGSALYSDGSTWIARPTLLVVAPVAATGLSIVAMPTIPAWAKRITLIADMLSTTGAATPPMVRVGSGGTPVTSGYEGAVSVTAIGSYTAAALSAGFSINPGAAGANIAIARVVLEHVGGNRWHCAGGTSFTSTQATAKVVGAVTLSGVLDVVQVVCGDSFDSGTVGMIIEG